MNQELQQILFDQQGSDSLFPFMWVMSSADTAQTLGMMETVKSCGIDAVCVESRTFEDYAGETWWPFITAILQEARRLKMRVWILDDVHYPTGSAAGAVEKNPDRRRLHLAEFHSDVIGPRRVEQRVFSYGPDDRLLAAVAVRRGAKGEELEKEFRLLNVEADSEFFSFTAPEGVWRIFQLWLTHEGSSSQKAYINMLDPESVQLMIDAVYEKHYAHLAGYFGKELAGFFSDEPSFGNTFFKNRAINTNHHHKTVGMPGLAMPWCDGLEKKLSERLGADILGQLPLLWYDGEGASDVRCAYMDTVSELYGKNFTRRIGDWCRARNVEYIGHIIEDNNSHCRLGNSPGHYFRSLEGQDMAGLDVVLTQVLPGFVHTDHCAALSAGFVDPLFYSFTLPRLGVSLAHLRPHMQNRTMCEIFGAYGWGLSVPDMKWLIDHFMVFGVNRFVPHAFSPIYPNPDCPPHFYGGGQNPQFEDFKELMRYTGKMIRLLEGNRVPAVAVLYHAEMEWSGRPFMLDEYVEQALTESQIDFDLVPADDLENPEVHGGVWTVGNARFRALVVPQAQWLPRRIVEHLNALGELGIRIVQVNSVTDGLNAACVELSRLPEYIDQLGLRSVKIETNEPYLRVLHVQKDGKDTFMLFNESVTAEIKTVLKLPVSGAYTFLDLLGERYADGFSQDGSVPVRLQPYESAVLAFGETGSACGSMPEEIRKPEQLTAKWEIAVADCEDMETWTVIARDAELKTVESDRANFAGKVRYTAILDHAWDIRQIELKGVGDTATLEINGRSAGRRICGPFLFRTEGMWQEGSNTVTVTVSTTLGRKLPERFSACMVSNPPGLDGPVLVYR